MFQPLLVLTYKKDILYQKLIMSLSVEKNIQEVQKICREKKLRLTSPRLKVLKTLLQTKTPSKAYTLLGKMAVPNTQPAAVYRALDFLIEHGFAHKIHSLNSYIACRHPQCAHDCYFLICRHCGSAQEYFGEATKQVIFQTACSKHYKDPQAVVEILANCNQCTHG